MQKLDMIKLRKNPEVLDNFLTENGQDEIAFLLLDYENRLISARSRLQEAKMEFKGDLEEFKHLALEPIMEEVTDLESKIESLESTLPDGFPFANAT